MMRQHKLKSCNAKRRYASENQYCQLVAAVTTVAKRCRQINATAMQIAETITKKDREPNMPEKDPTNYALLTYLWVLFLSAWGGVVSFLAKVKAGNARAFNFVELIGEIVTSGFAGVLTFWLCEAAGINGLVTAALVGISGHMGSRAIYKMEQWATSKLIK